MAGKSMKSFDLIIPLGRSNNRRYEPLTAYETETPGLFVHRDIGDHYRWAVTHWSGVLIGGYEWRTRHEALSFAAELRDVAEWHRPIERLYELAHSFREAMQEARFRVVGGRTGEKVTFSTGTGGNAPRELSEASGGEAA